jgi:hypothetical protein
MVWCLINSLCLKILQAGQAHLIKKATEVQIKMRKVPAKQNMIKVDNLKEEISAKEV